MGLHLFVLGRLATVFAFQLLLQFQCSFLRPFAQYDARFPLNIFELLAGRPLLLSVPRQIACNLQECRTV